MHRKLVCSELCNDTAPPYLSWQSKSKARVVYRCCSHGCSLLNSICSKGKSTWLSTWSWMLWTEGHLTKLYMVVLVGLPCTPWGRVSAPKYLPTFTKVQLPLVRKITMKKTKTQKLHNVEKGLLSCFSTKTLMKSSKCWRKYKHEWISIPILFISYTIWHIYLECENLCIHVCVDSYITNSHRLKQWFLIQFQFYFSTGNLPFKKTQILPRTQNKECWGIWPL